MDTALVNAPVATINISVTPAKKPITFQGTELLIPLCRDLAIVAQVTAKYVIMEIPVKSATQVMSSIQIKNANLKS